MTVTAPESALPETAMEVMFYHLERQPLERVLPSLLEKTRERGWRAVVQARSEAQSRQLDDWLWTYSEQSFLPHGLAQEATAARMPIVLTHGMDNPNRADVRFLLDGAVAEGAQGYRRCVHLFDGSDAEVLRQMRSEWKRVKALGLQLTYWQHNEAGRWERKA
jgi:DNA polymerase III subunit chi